MTTQNQFEVAEELQIVTIRTVNSSRNVVFGAFSDPKYLKSWWGPKDFSNTFHQFDFHEGGIWKFTMHGPDNGNYPNECEFIRIVEPKLIAWNHLSSPMFTVVFELEETGRNQTKVIFRMLFDTKEDRDRKLALISEKNEENMDRLEALLRK